MPVPVPLRYARLFSEQLVPVGVLTSSDMDWPWYNTTWSSTQTSAQYSLTYVLIRSYAGASNYGDGSLAGEENPQRMCSLFTFCISVEVLSLQSCQTDPLLQYLVYQ